jgi:Fe-S cluster assembly ATP-binding protein
LRLLEPRVAILDETDSGLDIDALRVIAKNIEEMRRADRSFLLITHYQRLLEYIRPDHVHVMASGRIVKSGGFELVKELEAKGYEAFVEAA